MLKSIGQKTKFTLSAVCGLAIALVSPATTAAAPSRLVVTTTSGSSGQALTEQGLRDALGFEPARIIQRRHGWHVVLPVVADVDQAQRALRSTRGVRDVHVDAMVDGSHKGKGRIENNGDSWRPSGYTPWHDTVMNLKRAQKKYGDAAGVVVAVLDSGLSITADGAAESPSLAGHPIAAGYNFVDDTDTTDDDNGHGTMMASIIAGIAAQVTLMPVKVLDYNRVGSESGLADGIDYAVAQGADIISLSLAFPAGYIPSTYLHHAINRADDAGVVIIAATGNHAQGEVSYPAAYGHAIAVASARLSKTQWGNKASAKATDWAEYSAWGSPVDIAGPGGHLDFDLNHDGYPDGVLAMGLSADGSYEDKLVSGTSAATAQVAGVAALMLAEGATPQQVRPALAASATDITLKDFDSLTGAGLVNARRALKQVKKQKALPALFTNFSMEILTNGVARRAVAYVEVVDADMNPVEGVEVRGHWRGDVRHDVAAVTDMDGVALVASLPVQGGALFEFTVDKIFGATGKGKSQKNVSIVPRAFARYGLDAYRQLASFTVARSSDDGTAGGAATTGAGAGVSPFLVAFPADDLHALVLTRLQTASRGPDLPAGVEPVRTIPEDLETWSTVPALLARNVGANAVAGPTGYVLLRELASVNCDVLGDSVIVALAGAGAGVSPFFDPDADDDDGIPQITILDRQVDSLLLNGDPTNKVDVDLVISDAVVVRTSDTGSLCAPAERVVSRSDALPSSVLDDGQRVVDGVAMSIVAFADEPEFAAWELGWADILGAMASSGVVASIDSVLEGTNAAQPFATGAQATMTSTDAAQGASQGMSAP